MKNEAVIIWGMLFGAVGLGYFIYGRKQKAVIPLVAGVLLFIVPYIFNNVYLLVIAGLVIAILPFFIRLK